MKFYLLLIIYSLVQLMVYVTGADAVWYTVVTIVLIGIIVWGVSAMRYNLFIKAQSKIKDAKTEVAITFDDGPDKRLTPQVLDLLKEYNAKATFFCIGNKIMGNEDIMKRMVKEGHSIGNHTYEHSNTFPVWSVRRMKHSITETDKVISNITGNECVMFRPPYGVTNNMIAAAIRQLGKKTIGWSIRTKDTCKTIEEVIRKVERNLEPGSIVLFHDTNTNILIELKASLEYCKAKGIKPVAITQNNIL